MNIKDILKKFLSIKGQKDIVKFFLDKFIALMNFNEYKTKFIVPMVSIKK